MNEPIKIIYKVKNNNEKPQYYIYIYIGDIPESIMKILNKIRELSFYESLVSLTKNELQDLENFYGNKWYSYFFNKHHLNSSYKNILSNSNSLNTLKKKIGEEWIKENIKSIKVSEKKQNTYGLLIKRNLVQHDLRVHKKEEYKIDEQNNYSIDKQVGGDDNETETPEEDETDDEYVDEQEQEVEEEIDDDDLEELEKLYQEEAVPSKEVKQTTELIKKAMDDENIFKKKESKMIKFDDSKETNIYKENINDVFIKNYVTEQYILKDDTIKTIKNKIFSSIKNNPKFGKKAYLMPSRQYLWSEYQIDKYYDKIMIGMKWIQKNELLKVDVEPNENIKVYEELRDSIKILRNDLKRFNSKIRREDEDNNILLDYENFYDNNEIFLSDVYNELGKDYTPSPEALTNLTDTYLKIYFPRIPVNEIKHIIDYLNDKPMIEKEKIETSFEIINSDLLLENEIVKLTEKIKMKNRNLKEGKGYQRILKENFVTQSMIHLLLNSYETETFKRIDLFKIFDDFVPTEKYPFLQFMTSTGNITFKFNEKEVEKFSQDKTMNEMVTSWFQNISHGLIFRIRTDDMKSDNYRFMTININEIGKLDYKIQWKEDDNATIDDISKTYNIIRDLIKDINETKIKHKFNMPNDDEFKTAFITTIQRFNLDDDYTINHNDFSKFARYFYPYFALVIEPRKRESKIHESESKSKFGTYLRYKRISKYENIMKIEQRIYYYMKNYEYTEQTLINEISKQFNLTLEKADEYLKKTQQKYPHIKKSRRELKKFDTSLKYKSPGIDIAIQGKTKDKYKIRISGARDKNQLQRILTILNILLYLYMETYLAKKTEWQYLKEKLKKLNNIAERRHMVTDFVKYADDKINIKAMASADKRRIGYKPEQGQSHWSRVCQNSGKTQRRRPQQFLAENIDQMLKMGYTINKATGLYERKLVTKKNGKTVTQVLRAVKLNELDEVGNPVGNEIYYTCSPEENGIHMYVGFLTKSKNPFGEYMPCCFKKDQYLSANEEKRNFFLSCIGKGETQMEKAQPTFSDQLYVLQDTNKIQANRFGFLPRLLDYYFNTLLDLKRTITQHYLILAEKGYFFKYGIEHGNNSFLSAIANILNISVDNMVEKLINKLKNDKNNLIFTALNNGDIKTNFESKEKYIDYLQNIPNIDYDNIIHLLTIPEILFENGLNIIILARTPKSMNADDDVKSRDNCYVVCQNVEELPNLLDTKRENIILYLEHDKYYPIFNVLKKERESKDITISKTFLYENKKTNIINHLKDFYYKNCMERTIKSIINKETVLTSKILVSKLLESKNEKYEPMYQYIDIRNKCRFIITKNGIIIPVVPSGSIYNIPIIKKLDQYYDTFSNTRKQLMKLYDDFKGTLDVQPFGVNGNKNGDSIEVRAIIIHSNELVPIKPETLKIREVEKENLIIDTNPFYEKIDEYLEKFYNKKLTPQVKNVEDNIDERVKIINYDKYYNESYELFRYTFSNFINKKDNKILKEKLTKIVNSNISYYDKQYKIKVLIYRLIDSDLLKKFIQLYNKDNNDTNNEENKEEFTKLTEPEESEIQYGGKFEKFVYIIDKIPDLNNYKINNIRELCSDDEKDVCYKKIHCKWTHSGCSLALTKKMVITFVNKICVEIVENNMKTKEILQLENYYVSDVVNKNYYTERPNQKVLKSTSDNIKKMIEVFLSSDEKQFGRKVKKFDQHEDDTLAKKYPMKDYGKKYVQLIIPDNNSILRAYANGFHWNENKYQDKYTRNIGYYSQKQTDIMVFLKSLIIGWALDKKNQEIMNKILKAYSNIDSIYSYVSQLAIDISTNNSGLIELFILNQIQKTPIVIYENDVVHHVFDKEIITSNMQKYDSSKNTINIQFIFSDFQSNESHDITDIPTSVEVLYF
jgi:hypothetical protein